MKNPVFLIGTLLVVVLVVAIVLIARNGGAGGPSPTDVVQAATDTFSPEQIALTPVSRNADWTPVERDFDGAPMVLVPAGCFEMGNDPDGRYWGSRQFVTGVPDGGRQCFEPFWIGKYEVTNAEYARFIEAGGYENPDYWTEASRSLSAANHKITQPRFWGDSRFNASRQPVVGVSWYEALAYARWSGCSLPTEAEWEYAARGPDGLIYPWGDEFNADNLVYEGNSNYQSAPVGSKPGGVSWAGALDMSGNLMEWASSEYRAYPYGVADGREIINSVSVRVLRGGSWLFSDSIARAASRNYFIPANRLSSVGFRVVCRP